ncbi:SH3 domain-containing protein [Pseudahrensia aquimaris]|uniref:SH3 domain-containing protein n=1 Tax=Pseudahrensia aquimaris TaxID=744461 RepID=A0ABW3FL18_9HYPH
MTLANTLKKAALAIVLAAPVMGAAVTTASAAGYQVRDTARVGGFPNWDQLNIRKWDASYSRKIGEAYRGDRVYVIRCKLKSGSDWCKISAGGTVGWVNGRYLRKGGRNFASAHPWYR